MGSTARLLFLGTPPFAVASLAALCEACLPPVAVVTAPDKPAGRGQKLQQSAVKQYAEANGLAVLQPPNLKAPSFLAELAALQLDLGIVVAFRMLPESVWGMPRLGTFNLHASLLPAYRGAAPINWAVMNGENETGATTFLLQHAIDTGNIMQQARLPIGPNETAGQLHDRLMALGAPLVVAGAQGLLAGSLHPTPQVLQGDEPHAPKLTRENTLIDFDKSAEVVHNHIRGLSPHPGAWAMLDGQAFKIYESRLSTMPFPLPTGRLKAEDGRLFVSCADAWLELLDVQAAGRKRLPAGDFLRGTNIDGKTLTA